MQIIDGKKVSISLREKLHEEVVCFQKEIGLAVILVGNDKASAVYVNNKEKACQEVGITSYFDRFSEETDEQTIIDKIIAYNQNPDIYGILVQLPLPKHLNERKILSYIDPKKDVDGFSNYQMGKLLLGEDCLVSCTPQGVMYLLDEYNIDCDGKNVVVIGRSNIVGKPISLLLLQKNATVTVCHSHTKNLEFYTKNADILVVAIGKPKMIKGDMVKEGVVVIDIGINRTEEGLCGDVDFESVSKKCSYITPVPGGVGPMTVTMLMYNTVKAAKNAH